MARSGGLNTFFEGNRSLRITMQNIALYNILRFSMCQKLDAYLWHRMHSMTEMVVVWFSAVLQRIYETLGIIY